MTPTVPAFATPLVLLVLLAFFFVVALAFAVWAALTVGDAAKRTQQPPQQRPAGQRQSTRQRHTERDREPKPWERQPGTVTQGTLWEARPETGRRRDAAAPKTPSVEQSSRAVVTPRKPNTDAFERFLESEKRRD